MSAVVAFPTGRPFMLPSQVGQRCAHPRFGVGTIVEVDGHKLTVTFDTAGQKRVVDVFVRLTAGAR